MWFACIDLASRAAAFATLRAIVHANAIRLGVVGSRRKEHAIDAAERAKRIEALDGGGNIELGGVRIFCRGSQPLFLQDDAASV